METIRAYTTIEQSRKLAKILSIKTADIYYMNGTKHVTDIPNYKTDFFNNLLEDDVPCWSLAALLNIIPKHIEYSTLRIDIDEKDFSIWYDEHCYGVNTELPDITTENPTDACYEMILKLHELNLL